MVVSGLLKLTELGVNMTPAEKLTEDYIEQLERLVAAHESTIQDMKNLLEIKLEQSQPGGDMEHAEVYESLENLKALYKLIGAYSD